MILTDPLVIKTKPTAYSKVGYNIFMRIKDSHQVAHTPMLKSNFMGPFSWEGLLIYPSGQEDFGEDIIERNHLHFNADALLTIKDMWAFNQVMQMPLEWIPYTPIDHSPVSPGIVRRLKYAFKVVSMSRFGYDELQKVNIDSTLIPHGVSDLYRPAEESREAVRRTFHIRPDEYVILFVGKNQIRKNLPRYLEIIAAAREEYPDMNVKGFMWTNVDEEVPLRPKMLELGLNEHVHWPNPDMYKHGLPEDLMVKLYNSADITICVSNEGFWLPGPESLACGVPIMAPDYAAAADRVAPGCGYKIKIHDWTSNNVIGVRQPLVDIGDAVDKIGKLMNADQEKVEKRCLEEAEKYSWDIIVKEKWLPFLEECERELLPMVVDGMITKWDQEVS